MIVSDRTDEALPSGKHRQPRLHAGDRDDPSATVARTMQGHPPRRNRPRRAASRRRSSARPSRAALTQPQAATARAMPTMAVAREQKDGAGRRYREPRERRQHRRAGVFMGERHRGEDLSSACPGMPSAIAASAPATAAVSRAAERAALEQAGDDRLRPGAPGRPPPAARGRARSRRRAIARRRRGGAVVGADMRGDRRRHHRGDGDRDDAERQLVEPVGVGEPRHRRRRRRCHDRAGDQGELRNAGGDHARQHHPEEAAHVRRRAELRRDRRIGQAEHRAADHQQLENSGDHDRARQQRADHRRVSESRERDAARPRRSSPR